MVHWKQEYVFSIWLSFDIPQPISAATSVSIGKHQSNRETKKISLKSYFMTQVTSVKMSYLALISGRNMT